MGGVVLAEWHHWADRSARDVSVELAAWVPDAPADEVVATRHQLVDIDGYIGRASPAAQLEARRAARVTEWHMAARWPANPDGAHRTDDRPSLASDGANREAWQKIYTVGRCALDWLMHPDRQPDELTQAACVRRGQESGESDEDDYEPPPDLIARLDTGATVVVSMRDRTLWRWLTSNKYATRIDRGSDWGNPFVLDQDGDRATVVDAYERFYLPHKPSLTGQLGSLRGRALGCWCAPDPCHGDVLARMAAR